MELTSADQQYIRDLLQRRQTVEQTADALTQHLARQAVQKIADHMASDAQGREMVRSLRWAPLIAPLDKNAEPELLNILEDGTRLERDLVRQVHHVKLVDLQEFAAEQGLDAVELLKLIQGEIESHRGWNRGPWTGHGQEFGRPFRVPSERRVEVDALNEVEKKRDATPIVRK